MGASYLGFVAVTLLSAVNYNVIVIKDIFVETVYNLDMQGN